MRKKRSAIAKKNLTWLAVLGLVMLLGTSLAAGIQLYFQNTRVYRDMGFSFVRLASVNINGNKIRRLLNRSDEIKAIGRDIFSDYEVLDEESETRALFERDEELKELVAYWQNIWFLLATGSIYGDEIDCLYVVVPEEDRLMYLWDSDPENPFLPFETAAYSEDEKENLLKVYNRELPEHFATYHENGRLIGVGMVPIYDMSGEVVAVAAVDIDYSDVRRVFAAMFLHIAIAITLIMLAAVTVYFWNIRRHIIVPVVKLNDATRELVEDLKNEKPFHVDVHTGDEIEVLAHSFEDMDLRLKEYIRENARISAEKERIGTELELATRIQTDMLPNIFPPFPDREEFDIYASMVPAKEVGGDFYDFFLIDEDHLGLVIADVSGKGVPAALFMMMTKIMLKNYALAGLSPKAVLEAVNEQICQNNKEDMFVTVWFGVLDLKTGVITAANAGHEYPFIRHPGGAYELFKDRHGFVIGGYEGIRYKEYTFTLEPGSVLFLYTDGLPEAADERNQLFGTDRVLEVLNRIPGDDPEEILRVVRRAADDFAGSAPQFDDMTLLCITYKGNPPAERGDI